MAGVRNTNIFNRNDRAVIGWYWALASREVRRGEVKPARVLGRDLVVWRGEDGVAQAADAYCPHMGAHLAEGRVDGNALRCFFHDWKFARDGGCVEVPCLPRPPRARVKTWPTAERYGLVWVWTGEGDSAGELPYVPELKDDDCDALLGNRFVKNCHPNVVLINAIDEHHFNSVHDLPVDLHMETRRVSPTVQTFSNATTPPDSPLGRVLRRFYRGPLTYSMAYHYGSSGTVTLGPDALHFHIMFALRMIDGGRTEGQTVLITRKRSGLSGRAIDRVLLRLTEVVGNYFAKGDTQVFQTMKFDFQTPTRADHAIIDFIQHVEAQPAMAWGSWQPADEAQDSDLEAHGVIPCDPVSDAGGDRSVGGRARIHLEVVSG